MKLSRSARSLVDRYGAALGVLLGLVLVVNFAPATEQSGVGASGGSDGTSSTDGGFEVARSSDTPLERTGGGPGGTGRASSGGSTAPGQSGDAAAADGGSGDGGTPGSHGDLLPTACRPADGRQPGIHWGMPACAPVFAGGNGGSTYKGVDRDTITVALYIAEKDQVTNSIGASAGLNSAKGVRDSVETLVTYFNQHFETYAREVKIVPVIASGDANDDAASRSDAVKIAMEIEAFAALATITNPVLCEELAARGVLCMLPYSGLGRSYYDKTAPYVWSIFPNLEDTYLHLAEYIHKRLAGRPPAKAGQASLQLTNRKFGLIYLEGGLNGSSSPNVSGEIDARDFFITELARRGIPLTAHAGYQYDLSRAGEQATNVIVKMKDAGVSTILLVGDPIMPVFLTKEATRQQYFPEWVMSSPLTDTTLFGRLYDQAQWRNAFGLSAFEVFPENFEVTMGYREYHHANPEAEPGDESSSINGHRWVLHLFFTGVHMAGPNLTPQTFAAGMRRYPATGGTPGYQLFDWSQGSSGIKDFTEVFWDPTGRGPDETGASAVGILLKAEQGTRFRAGGWPLGEPAFDKSRAVFVSDELARHPDHEQDGHTHDRRCRSCRD